MASLIRKAYAGYKLVFEEFADERTRDWFLVAKPYQGLLLLAVYLMFVLKWGPTWMKKRPAYNIDRILIAYNALQVVACGYVFGAGVYNAWGWDYKWICEPVDYSRSTKAMAIANIVYFYYALKLVDLLDTVFFVLRKKFNQVTFLHIYHHTGMVMLVWGGVTYFPGGHGTLIGVINSFVHVVMYAYYLLTVVIPSVKQSMWWKKYITQLQILQFIWIVVHMGSIVFIPDCEFPRWVSAIFLPQNIFMLVLFIDFYIKTYIKKPKENVKNNGKMHTTLKRDSENGKEILTKVSENGRHATGINGHGNTNDVSNTNGKED